MYRVIRTEKEVKVMDNKGGTVYSAPLDCYLIYNEGKSVDKVSDLDDANLLKALVGAVVIPRTLIDKA